MTERMFIQLMADSHTENVMRNRTCGCSAYIFMEETVNPDGTVSGCCRIPDSRSEQSVKLERSLRIHENALRMLSE